MEDPTRAVEPDLARLACMQQRKLATLILSCFMVVSTRVREYERGYRNYKVSVGKGAVSPGGTV